MITTVVTLSIVATFVSCLITDGADKRKEYRAYE